MNQAKSAFTPRTKSDWLKKIKADLGDRPYSDLFWKVSDEIVMEPVYTSEDIDAGKLHPVLKTGQGWQIGQYILVTDPAEANQMALESLNGGANALLFDFQKSLSFRDLDKLFGKIHLDYLSCHFRIRDNHMASFTTLIEFLQKYGGDHKVGQGTMNLHEGLSKKSWTIEEANELAEKSQFLPDVGFISIDEHSYREEENIEKRLARMLFTTNLYVQKGTDSEMDLKALCRLIYFSFDINESYFIVIAKIRAWRFLWNNLLSAYGIRPFPATVHAHISGDLRVNDMNDRLIEHTILTMGAVLGGADRIFIPPIDAGERSSGTRFSRRMSRNIQHLLQLEAHLDKVEDPLAGSFMMESLTGKIARLAWDHFRHGMNSKPA